jgi:hypothetical protein
MNSVIVDVTRRRLDTCAREVKSTRRADVL